MEHKSASIRISHWSRVILKFLRTWVYCLFLYHFILRIFPFYMLTKEKSFYEIIFSGFHSLRYKIYKHSFELMLSRWNVSVVDQLFGKFLHFWIQLSMKFRKKIHWNYSVENLIILFLYWQFSNNIYRLKDAVKPILSEQIETV